MLVQLVLVAVSFVINLSMFGSAFGGSWTTDATIVMLPMSLALRGLALRTFGVSERPFRHASIADIVAIAQAVATSSVVLYLVYRVLAWQFGLFLPGVLFVGDALTVFLLFSGLQFSVRLYQMNSDQGAGRNADAKRVLIVGAGDAGASVLKEMLYSPQSGVVPVALVDDDPTKKGTLICGVPVVGGVESLCDVLFTYGACEVLICIPSATQAQLHRILAACRQCAAPVMTLPSVADLLHHRASARDLRSLSIEDVLQRERFVPDLSQTRNLAGGKIVMVTGAGGSIGSELCRQIAAAQPRKLILVEKSENSLFYCHMGIEESFPGLDILPVLMDITDQHQVRELALRERPELIFHAAAFKHVGMMELHPDQAIRNNVLGTRNVIRAAVEARVQTFVNISTDKAVNPRNYMGLSKKLAELLVKETAARHQMRFMNVRFGNVAGSTGSVLRIFSERIIKGKALRVTDPHATRYFMSIPEAVYLILCAASLGAGGETFILNMGNPVNIYELARTMSLFAGVLPGEELPIRFTGLRDGEKINEELWESWECPRVTENPQIFSISGDNPVVIDIDTAVERFQELIDSHDQSGLVECLGELVPSFRQERAGESVPAAVSYVHENVARAS